MLITGVAVVWSRRILFVDVWTEIAENEPLISSAVNMGNRVPFAGVSERTIVSDPPSTTVPFTVMGAAVTAGDIELIITAVEGRLMEPAIMIV